MKRTVMLFVFAAAMAFLGCSGNRAEELFETARLEELQNNEEHAKKLYQKIVDKYPNSQYAENAQERLSELSKDQ